MNKYKLFLIKLLISIIGTICIVVVLFLTFSLMVEKNYFNNKDAEMIYSWYKLKKNYADKHKNKKKIIIVSGSNAMFGLNSKLLEKKIKSSCYKLCNSRRLKKLHFHSSKRNYSKK